MKHNARRMTLLAATVAVTLSACSPTDNTQTTASDNKPTVADAEKFAADAEIKLEKLGIEAARTDWIASTYIMDDSELLTAKRQEEFTALGVQLANESKRFIGLDLPFDVARKLEKIRLGLVLPAPSDAAKTEELAKINASLNAQYGKGKWCNDKGECQSIGDIEDVLADLKSTPEQKLAAWQGWHDSVGSPMRREYARMVEITNEGSTELGFADTGALWRSKYDMPANDFAAELDRLWGQVKPLYESLHCYVRSELNQKYGDNVVAKSGAIPAHLLGNIWAQQWGNLYPMMKPEGANVEPWNDALVKKYGAATELHKQEKAITDWKSIPEGKMVLAGENFFSSLGFAPLPDTFWTRSQFLKPRDRDVICHASAWDIDNQDDLRIKMCIKMNEDDFVTIHHELGHNYYQRAYKAQPFLYKDSANDGFHEAIGDTIALGITPSYLKQIGLVDKEPDASQDVALLLQRALDKVAFMPFGLLVDQWRWKVFSGEIKPENYNAGWWQLREKYQGVKSVVERNETQFDPGAKYHVPGGVPYSRYFLAHILQFQFYREMCKQAGFQGPLHRCTFYGNKEVGARLNQMLEMGASKPWQDALQAMTGSREMDATAVVEYFAPLKAWLDQQNQGQTCGW